MTWSGLHFRVRKEWSGSTCTHLNDLLRSAGDAEECSLFGVDASRRDQGCQVTTTRAESRFGMRRDVAATSPSRWDSTSAVGK
jgi:hypothetical protein